MKHNEVRELIDRSPFCQEALRDVAALLPKGDAELDAMLTEMPGAIRCAAFFL
jgi:hypothetical protein